MGFQTHVSAAAAKNADTPGQARTAEKPHPGAADMHGGGERRTEREYGLLHANCRATSAGLTRQGSGIKRELRADFSLSRGLVARAPSG